MNKLFLATLIIGVISAQSFLGNSNCQLEGKRCGHEAGSCCSGLLCVLEKGNLLGATGKCQPEGTVNRCLTRGSKCGHDLAGSCCQGLSCKSSRAGLGASGTCEEIDFAAVKLASFPTCLKDLQKTSADLSTLKTAIENKDIAQVISDAQAIVSDVNSLKTDCSSIQAVASLATDPEACLTDLETLVGLAQKISSDIQSQNVQALLQDVPALVSDGQALLKDCDIRINYGRKLSADFPTCLRDVQQTIGDIESLKSAIQAGDIGAVITKAQGVISDASLLKNDCVTIENVSRFAADPQACLVDLEGFVQVAERVAEDVKTYNFQALLQDVNVLVQDGQAVAKDCASTRSRKRVLVEDIPTCLRDVQKTVSDAQALETAIKGADVSGIILDAQSLISDVSLLKTDCASLKALAQLTVNPQACLSDVETIVQVAQRVVSDIQSQNIQGLLQDLPALVQDGQAAARDCGLSISNKRVLATDIPTCLREVQKTVSDVQALATAVQGGDIAGIITDAQEVVADVNLLKSDCASLEALAVFTADPQACLSDIETLVQVAQKVASDIQSQDVAALLQDVPTLVTDGQAAARDCGLSLPKGGKRVLATDIPTCLREVQKTVSDVQALATAVQGGDIAGIITDAQEVVADVNLLKTDCASLEALAVFTADPQACLNDIETLVQVAQKVASDIQSQDVAALLQDVPALVTDGQSAARDCGLSLPKGGKRVLATDIPTCLKDVQKTVSDVQALATAVQGGDIAGIITDAQEVVSDVNLLKSDCASLEALAIFTADPQACLNDIEVLVQVAQKVAADIQGQDIAALLQDVPALVSDGQAVSRDCALSA